MTVPIYQAGDVSARVRQAKQNQVGFLQQIEQIRTQQQQVLVASWAQLEAARAQLESDQVAVESNKVALQGVREEEKVGQRTLLDVLNAELEYLNSQVSLETTRRNLVVAAYNVISAMGRLDAAWIGAAAYVYDPVVHYKEVRRKWFGLSITTPTAAARSSRPPPSMSRCRPRSEAQVAVAALRFHRENVDPKLSFGC